MAVKPFSKEQLNFFKFSTLVLDEFPKVLRKIFITMWDSKVAIKPGFIVWDDSTKVRNMLLTSEGGKSAIPTTKSIEEWDCPAMFKATIYAKTFGVPTLNDLYLTKMKPASGTFHASVQSSTRNQDETYTLVIDQLRLLRNKHCHLSEAELSKTDFDTYVQLVTCALTAVNFDTAFVDAIGQMTEDDFPTEKVQKLRDCRVKELQASNVFHESIEQKLSSIEKQTEKIENVEQELSDIREMVKKSSLEDRGVPGTLPKPHIPSSDPMFTGREVEIKEITNLITDQSTRLLNIWGSPGFGKTSTAVEVARHLNVSPGYPVYFFRLQYIDTVDKFLSKVSSIFKSNVVDPNVRPSDRLVSIFREISSPVILVFDNLDDLLTRETSSTQLTNLFNEFLDSNVSIKILFTTRGLLPKTRGQVKGFRDVRIRPLSSFSSVEFVRQLLPSFSESVVAKVVRISFHVPLAMKILASSLVENSEDIANKMLDEFNFSENLLEQIDIHAYEEKMQTIFESLFERLKLNEKQALIYLTAFPSAVISEDAALYVVSGEMGSTSKAVTSLNTLVKKALIDKDLDGKYYSIHPLIYSFVMDKAKQRDFETVLNSSRLRFCRYYLLLFERLNDDFLAGKLVDCPQLQDTMHHLSTAMFQSITNISENSNDLFRILSKSEIFFFLINVPCSASQDIYKLYDLAIEKSKTLTNDLIYLKLHVSKYFQRIAFSFSVKRVNVDIPKSVRENIDQLSDGTAAKLFCYEAIFDICNGMDVYNGIQRIEKCLGSLQDCTDHLLLKCMCLQILIAYYSSLNQLDKSCKFREMAIDVCTEICNFNLFLIDDCDHKTDDVGESLILFSYLFSTWSEKFAPAEIKRYLFNSVYKIQQQKEVGECGSYYLHQIICYGYYLVAFLGVSAGQETIINEKIEFLQKSLIGFQDSSVRTDKAFPDISQKSMAYSTGRLLFCYDLKSAFTDEKDVSIEACHNALDLSLQHFGKRHKRTAQCYNNIGSAENNAENYISALSAFDQAIEIMLTVNRQPDDFEFLADLYLEKGKTHVRLREFEKAFACYEEACNIKITKNNDEESEEIAEILFLIGLLQFERMNLTSALATLERALRITINLFSERRCSYMNVVLNYHSVGCVYNRLGNDTKSRVCFENALEILKTSTDDERESKECTSLKCSIYLDLLDLKLNENLYVQLLDRSLPVIKEHNKSLLPIVYLSLCSNQLESGKKEAGLAFLQKALDLDLDVIQRQDVDIRVHTVLCYTRVVSTLINIGECKLAKNTLDRGLQIADSIPEARKPPFIFRCYFLKGRIYMEEHEYASAIESLQHALLQLSEVSFDAGDKFKEFHCRSLIAIAHYHQGNYKDALYEKLSIIKDHLVVGSEYEADAYVFVAEIAQKMKNKRFVVKNLHLAYEAYSKVLGKNHPKTLQSYIAYVREYVLG